MFARLSLSKAALSAALVLATLTSPAHGLFPDEAGRIDWYRAQIGAPTNIVPVYNFTNEASAPSLLAITDRNILASLSADSGEIAWRQVFEDHEHIKALRVHSNQALTLSGNNATSVHVWEVDSGALAWAFSRGPDAGYRKGSGAAEFVPQAEGGSHVVAVAGDSLVRLAPGQSTPVWELPLNSTATYRRIVVEDQRAFVIGDARPTKKNPRSRLLVAEVDLESGLLVKRYHTASEQVLGNGRVLVLQSSVNGSYLIWRDEKNIVWFVHRLGMTNPEWEIYHPKMVQVELTPQDMLTSTLHELDSTSQGIHENPRFVMAYLKDGKEKAVVVEMHRSGDRLEMRKIAGFRSHQALVGGFGLENAEHQLSRTVVSLRPAAAGDTLAWRVYGGDSNATHSGTVSYDQNTFGAVARTSLYWTGGEPRVLVQTSGGLVMALASGQSAPVWQRDESLAHASDMAFLDLPAPASSAEYSAKATDPSVLKSAVARFILRWAESTRRILNWVLSGFGLWGSDATLEVPAAGTGSAEAAVLTGDHFGFRKLAIFGSSSGVVAALGTQDGARAWTRYLAIDGTPVRVQNVFVTRRSQPLSSSPPLVTVVGTLGAKGHTVVATLNALTGELTGQDSESLSAQSFRHTKVFALPAVDESNGQQLLALVHKAASSDDGSPRLTLWPTTSTATQAFCAIPEPVYFDTGAHKGSIQLSGHLATCAATTDDANADADADAVIQVTRQWTFDLPTGETLVSATGYEEGAERTALLGRVLGDRRVLYKYLNPHLLTVATRFTATLENQQLQQGLGVYLVDRVSGRLLHSSVHMGAHESLTRPFLAVQAENRIVYQFWQEGSPSVPGVRQSSQSVRGWITVVSDLYESDQPDTRHSSAQETSLDLQLPYVVSAAFAAPEAATALGVTRTGSRITTRDVLFGLASGKLLALPDQMLDPRRPRGRQPTKDEQAEGLIPYQPALPLDAKRVLSHGHQVKGIRHVVSAATHLESTALVACFGLDVFASRTSPSGTFDQLAPSFSKVNLVATTLALAAGCLLAGPMVRRKLANQAWA
ncbi:hypothetical protein GGI07_000757 [Coemansia sp. Benny D115]|nr:hypothetical protein GGI07_000757 [Coemansia sp. Benny D115]